MSPFIKVTVASRVFCIAVILGLGVLSRDTEALLSLAVIAIAASTATYLTLATPLATIVVVVVEAALTGLIITLALPGSVVFLPYLVVLTLIAGLTRGIVGVSAVAIAQFVAMALITVTSSQGATLAGVLELLSPWLITSIGAGLLGAWLAHVRSVGVPDKEDTASYESAHRLLAQLRTVAKRLSSGLDPVTMATQILGEVSQHISLDQGSVYIRTSGGTLSRLAHRGADDPLDQQPSITEQCWFEMKPVLADAPPSRTCVALPLRVGSRMVGVVTGTCSGRPRPSALRESTRLLDAYSMRLDTALTFDEVRTIATLEERHRLAREIHDGIAQEVASMGYTVDELVSSADSDEQARALGLLRQEITRVVSELRLSIFDLRSEALLENGLGAALSEYARQIGARSGLTVHLTLGEATTRLNAEAEMQLLRIAQEAITNARKHSGARNLWVSCRVFPPFAEIEVRDDGIGLASGGEDSYGLRTMHERAERLNGRLAFHKNVERAVRPGTVVRVTVGEDPIASSCAGLQTATPGR